MSIVADAGIPFRADIDREARRGRVRGLPGIDGIDFVEILSNHEGTPGYIPAAPEQQTVVVHLLNGPVPGTWDASVPRIIGGVREDPALNPVTVLWAYPAEALVGTAGTPATDPLDGVTAGDRQLVDQAIETDEQRRRAFVVRTSSTGDWSTYLLQLQGSGGALAPAGIDVPLATGEFTFTVDCPSDLDCRVSVETPPAVETLLPGDYLARDYEALRIRLLDRLATLVPDWTDRSPADPGVMLVELFAAQGDRLAYWQDAVAAEAFLGTAHRRTSVRRHARLLNYDVHEGCSARTWLAFTTNTDLVVAHGTPVTDLQQSVTDADDGTAQSVVELGGCVFETCGDVAIQPERNALPLFAWGDADHALSAGATAAFVSTPSGVDPQLRSGDVLILADQDVNGVPQQGDPARRFPVRLIENARHHLDPLTPGVDVWELRWSAADALADGLSVRTSGSDDPLSVALANVVLADHGATILDERLVPPTVTDDYQPRLAHPGLAYVDPSHSDSQLASDSALATVRPDPRRARAALRLYDGQRTWTAQPDLLASGRLSNHVVVEPEPGGFSRIRFGDGINGRAPAVRSVPLATYRIGGGTLGNVAPDRLVRLLTLADGRAPVGAGATVSVWNPIPAAGGVEPELLEQVRQLAPSAFRRQLRAVTSADYAEITERNVGVQRSIARRRWAGSWYAEEVTVDPVAIRASDTLLIDELAAELEVRRMAGVDVEFERPIYVALHLEIFGCVQSGFRRADVEARLRELLSARILSDGSRGFFHVDNFTFGQPLVLSDLVAVVMSVDGMAWAELTRFSRMGASARDADDALAGGRLLMAPREVLRCDSDLNNPEAGRVDLRLGGGS